MYCMLLTGDRDGGCVGELRDRLRSGLEAQEKTLSAVAAVVAGTGGSGEAAVTVVTGGEEGADLEVLPKTLRPESGAGSGSRVR